MKKRVLSILLSLALLCSSMSNFVIAVNAENEATDGKEYYNGHTYKVFDQSLTWTEAKEYCESLGGHLVTITSQEEQNIISSFIEDVNQPYVRIGAIRNNNNQFEWITGEPWNYTNWATGEPNNQSNKEYYGMIYTPSSEFPVGKWNDTSGDWAVGNYFHHDHFIVYDLAVGGRFTGILNASGITALDNGPARMCIDYVRVYQK